MGMPGCGNTRKNGRRHLDKQIKDHHNYISAPQNTQASKTRTAFTPKQGRNYRLKSLRDNGGKVSNKIEAVRQPR